MAVMKAAMAAYGWQVRTAGPRSSAHVVSGRGIAYAVRSQTVVAQIAEVEVHRRTGPVWVKRMVTFQH